LVFWSNFAHWVADWLAAQAQDHFAQVLQQVRTQVRIAANTPVVVLTNISGQMLEFAADGSYADVQIRPDSPFVYQFPMPLFQTWEQLWPVSSVSVKGAIDYPCRQDFTITGRCAVCPNQRESAGKSS